MFYLQLVLQIRLRDLVFGLANQARAYPFAAAWSHSLHCPLFLLIKFRLNKNTQKTLAKPTAVSASAAESRFSKACYRHKLSIDICISIRRKRMFLFLIKSTQEIALKNEEDMEMFIDNEIADIIINKH